MLQGNNFVERAKREINIETYISRFVKLKRQGRRALGLCPFHNEKSPSFHVSIDLGFFHCFGCGKSGDIFTFVREYEKVDFRRALEILSDFSGIPLDQKIDQSEQKEKEELFLLNESFLKYFQSNLFSSEGKLALQYLEDRGISSSDIQRFELGLALPGFDNSLSQLLLSPEKTKNALKLGLVKQSDKNRNPYDFFRDRIMFPIRDSNGRVCGFGGRTYRPNSEEAKYINSPASPIYDKGKMFYGLFQSQSSIRKSRQVFLVEGYLDVIGMHSREFDNTVAPLGTALTPHQVRILKNYADRLILLFDGDNAGRKAALRGSEICLREGVSCEIVLLEEGMDPFDLSRKKTRVEMTEVLGKSLPQSQFILQETLENADRSSPPEKKQKALENLFQFIKSLEKATDQELYVKEGARILGLSISTIWNDFKKDGKVTLGSSGVDINKSTAKKARQSTALEVCERRILSLLILHNDLFRFVEDLLNLEFQDPESDLLWNLLYSRYSGSEYIGPDLLSEEEIPDSIREVIMPYLFSDGEEDLGEEKSSLMEEVFSSLLRKHKILLIERELDFLMSNNSVPSTNQENLLKMMSLRSEKDRLVAEIRMSNVKERG